MQRIFKLQDLIGIICHHSSFALATVTMLHIRQNGRRGSGVHWRPPLSMGELVPGKRHLPKFYSVHHTAVDNQRNTAIGSICMVEQVVNHSPKVLTLRSQFFMNHHPQSFMNNSQLKD